ncbi:MAG: flagellar hook-associated protein FlgK [Lachnospiraceae bacterium]|nr:flagellar hook-associated protein FlgK [Lachnospiraceae bacterium]
MGLFGSLYLGVSGLQSGQESLNVVAHNVTNTDTEGYTRQQVSYGTREYNKLSNTATGIGLKQTGLGVYISEVRQVRDRFVDASYRNQAGRQGFYDASWAAIEEVQDIFGEMDGPTFEQSMENLWYAVSELAKEPCSEVNQSMVIQYAQSFVEAAQNCYKDLSAYQDKLNERIKGCVDEINSLGYEIYELNKKIRNIATGGIENPNDLYDQRNLALDKLGAMANISYQEDFFGNVLVKIEGHDFVMMNGVSEMGYQAEDDERVGEPGFYNVFWKDSATVLSRDENGYPSKYVQDTVRNNPLSDTTATGAVFNWELPISSKLDTDVGELKGLLLARGTHRGNYRDLESKESYATVSDSVIMNLMAEFDGLVHNLTNAVNDTLKNVTMTGVERLDGLLEDYDKYYVYNTTDQAYSNRWLFVNPNKNTDAANEADSTAFREEVLDLIRNADGSAKVLTEADVKAVKDKLGSIRDHIMTDEGRTQLDKLITEVDKALTPMIGRDNELNKAMGYMRDVNGRPVQIFERISTDEYYKAADGSYLSMKGEDPTNSSTWFTTSNLVVSADLLQYPTHIGLRLPDGSEDRATAEALRDAFTDAKYVLNPTLTNPTSLQKYYANFVAQIANSGNVYKNLKENQDLTVDAIEANRQGSIGVATDEELSNMIKYQNAYNASSRFINVIDECIEHLINTLGS